MIDVFMTPQSDEEFYDEGMSPEEVQLSPPDDPLEHPSQLKPLVSTFLGEVDDEAGLEARGTDSDAELRPEKNAQAEEAGEKSAAEVGEPPKDNRNEVEEQKKDGDAVADDVPSD